MRFIRNGSLSMLVMLVLLAALMGTAFPARASSNDSVKQAYFYAPSGESAASIAANADWISYGMQYDQEIRAARQAGYVGPALVYYLAAEVEGPKPSGANGSACGSFSPWHNSLTYTAGIFCSEVNGHEDWFLHNGAGKRIYSVQSSTHYFYRNSP